jgi:hypothetical protein
LVARPAAYDALLTVGLPTPPVYEVSGEAGARLFHRAIQGVSAVHGHGSSVDVHDVGEYAGMRMFLIGDSTGGFALRDGDELVSVFSASGTRRGDALVATSVAAGARRADCFAIPAFEGDQLGMLPALYARHGFAVVASVDINDRYDHPADAARVAVLALVPDGADVEVRQFDKDGYDQALAYRDQLSVSGRLGVSDPPDPPVEIGFEPGALPARRPGSGGSPSAGAVRLDKTGVLGDVEGGVPGGGRRPG